MTVIDKETWPRREHYDFFVPMSDPFYTLTFPVDVTALRAWCKANRQPFYPAMVYAVTKAMEKVDAFHYKDRDGVIVRHDTLVPSFTDLKPGGDLFYIVTLEAGEDPADFCRRAKEQSAAQTAFITDEPWDGDQLVYFTCLPWFPVSVPRAAWGRWEEQGDRTSLLVSLELNHRLLDGVHVGKCYEALNEWMKQL